MSSNRYVVKIGTSTLTGGSTKVDMPRLIDLVRQLTALKKRGIEVLLVSSGAIAAGRELLHDPAFSKHVPRKQMLSSIGQPRLMSIYMDIFAMYGAVAAQVLLTRRDIVNRTGYLNARNTIELLLSHGVIPILNENDTTATDEIRLGDNDTLSAYVSGLAGAGMLILMTDQDGLFTTNPTSHADAALISRVEGSEIPAEIWMAAGGTSTGLGTGGMATKVRAADIARRMGTVVKIVDGNIPDCLLKIADGEEFGTTFSPIRSTLESRKRYLLSGYRADGSAIIVDAGAAAALRNGKSLLPAGIRDASGAFERGETVRIVDPKGREIAIGMTNYSCGDVAKLSGCQAGEIERVLGYSFGDEVVHHDHMIFDREEN